MLCNFITVHFEAQKQVWLLGMPANHTKNVSQKWAWNPDSDFFSQNSSFHNMKPVPFVSCSNLSVQRRGAISQLPLRTVAFSYWLLTAGVPSRMCRTPFHFPRLDFGSPVPPILITQPVQVTCVDPS